MERNTKTRVSTKQSAFVMNDPVKGPDGKNLPATPKLDEQGNKIPCPAIETDLTIDWEGMSDAEVQALAQQALVVKLQGGWRSNGIPTAATVKAADHKVGARVPKAAPVTIESLIEAAKSDPVKKAELIARLQAV